MDITTQRSSEHTLLTFRNYLNHFTYRNKIFYLRISKMRLCIRLAIHFCHIANLYGRDRDRERIRVVIKKLRQYHK